MSKSIYNETSGARKKKQQFEKLNSARGLFRNACLTNSYERAVRTRVFNNIRVTTDVIINMQV